MGNAREPVGFEGTKEAHSFGPGVNTDDIDRKDLYSTTYEWLELFAKFCRNSEGFKMI